MPSQAAIAQQRRRSIANILGYVEHEILTQLAVKPMAIQELVAASQDVIKIGSVYVMLFRLTNKELVKSRLVKPAKGTRGPRRRIYSITQRGRRHLKIAEQILKLLAELSQSFGAKNDPE